MKGEFIPLINDFNLAAKDIVLEQEETIFWADTTVGTRILVITDLASSLGLYTYKQLVKSGVSLVQKDNSSWSRNSVEPVATEEWKESEKQEDGETGNTEAAGQTCALTGQTGAEDLQRGMEDRWPRGADL
ncbi:hypothetical protein NDU88_000931 [Pleurodeles waltl]|uniref:Uncharacterized protein n=1 Tax=Pleurodeles waltl TaxID=8319 RepID=A0AAV7LEG4_PLEWA|nr:hypothetical protein NDU88_000931 [Pleurodeles waltl]